MIAESSDPGALTLVAQVSRQMINGLMTWDNRAFGLTWGLGGFLLTPFLGKIGAEGAQRLRQRGADELKTTFAAV